MIVIKKYFFFLFIFFFLFSFNVNSKNIIDLNNNSIAILKKDNNVSLLIKCNDNYSLLVLSGINDRYSYFTKDISNLLYIDKIESIDVDGFKIEKNSFILIDMLDKNFCIYDYKIYKESDFSMCNYIYILNNTRDVYINLNNNMNCLFYNEYSKFSNKFLEEIFKTWIDTNVISDNEIIVIDFNYDYEIKNYTLKI